MIGILFFYCCISTLSLQGSSYVCNGAISFIFFSINELFIYNLDSIKLRCIQVGKSAQFVLLNFFNKIKKSDRLEFFFNRIERLLYDKSAK